MQNIDLLVLVAGLCLVDKLRNGIVNGVVTIVENLPGACVWLVINTFKLPWHLRDLFNAVKNYFTSPIFLKRAKKFQQLRRGYYSFIIMVGLYAFSFFLPLFINNQAYYVSYNGQSHYPIIYEMPILRSLPFWPKKTFYANEFGLDEQGPVNFRELKRHFEKEGKGNSVVMPFYPYSPIESTSIMNEYPDKNPPHSPDDLHWFGTDDRGRDVFARLAYGFNISMTFALVVCFFSYLIGVSIGGYLGYFGGVFDIVVQRFVEIWSAIPFLYAIMIVASIYTKAGFWTLVFLLSIFQWMGMTFYIRGEFLREKAKDYVSAALSIGVKDQAIIFRHILPNALTPVISFLPFAIVGNITALVSLDFLGFGLPAPTPSWGELMSQGMSQLKSPWLVFAPIGALFGTLMLVSFIGEAVREAFDPKQYSRLR